MNVTRTSHVKVLGCNVRVPNWVIVDRRWSAAKIARVEQQAQALGDIQNFVVRSPLFPVVCVALFFGLIGFATWVIPRLVDAML